MLSQMEKDKYHDFTHMWNQKKKPQTQTNQQTREQKNKLTDIGNRLMVTRGEGSCGVVEMGEGGSTVR